MGANAGEELQGYFESCYKNYFRQNPPYKIASYLKIVRRFHNQRGNLLDIGCGYGLFLEQAQKFYHVFGTEIHNYALESVKQRLANVHFRNDALPLIGFNEQMDVITLFDVIEHTNNLEKNFNAIAKQLSQGGTVVIVVPVYDGPLGPLVRLLDKDPIHIHKESRYFWLEKVSSNFEISYWTGVFRYLTLGRFYMHFFTKVFRRISPAILIVARKVN